MEDLGPDLLCWGTAQRATASEFLERAVRYGVRDMPTVPFMEGVVFGEVPQGEEDLRFAEPEMEKMLKLRMVERVGEKEVWRLVRSGKMVSSAFVALKGDEGEKKGSFLLNFNSKSNYWPRGSVRMENI